MEADLHSLLEPQKPGGGGGGGGRPPAAPPQILAKVDILPIENNS